MAQTALKMLKTKFTTSPTLKQPDSNFPFVTVAAPDCRTEAVLSQGHGITGTIYPHAFFSRKLTPEEQKYDVGNKELLSINVVLEEWRQWLEEAAHIFQVITNHNLQYIKSAKHLNSWQARWSLFFTRIQFIVTY